MERINITHIKLRQNDIQIALTQHISRSYPDLAPGDYEIGFVACSAWEITVSFTKNTKEPREPK